MRKSRSGENRTSAIIRFFFGLCSLTLLIFVAYYFVAVQDWSFLIKDAAVSRPAQTAGAQAVSPFETSAARQANGEQEPGEEPETVVPGETDEPTTQPVGASPTPTAQPTFTPRPVPTPEPAPTPVPTKIPASSVSKLRSRKFKMPQEGSNGQIGISSCYVSKPDGYQIMVLEGWCYVDDAAFNGENSTTYIVTVNETSGEKRLYQATNVPGVSGRAHKSICMNPGSADWRLTLDASEYPDGIYRLAAGLGYKSSGDNKKQYVVFPFDSGYTFKVYNGEIIAGVQTTVEE